jgi:hypothetical protein
VTQRKHPRIKEEIARKQGFRRGLSVVRTWVVEARNHQKRQQKSNNAKLNPDLEDQYEYAANLLHTLYHKINDAIKGVK